ncbi:MAG TPA: hypothetical protein DCZ48_03085, partial [Methylococcaceae bacterium]|nr:hypothetical protein [Methylococcaceae bacterium]
PVTASRAWETAMNTKLRTFTVRFEIRRRVKSSRFCKAYSRLLGLMIEWGLMLTPWNTFNVRMPGRITPKKLYFSLIKAVLFNTVLIRCFAIAPNLRKNATFR